MRRQLLLHTVRPVSRLATALHAAFARATVDAPAAGALDRSAGLFFELRRSNGSHRGR
jgi:hypothetical protein